MTAKRESTGLPSQPGDTYSEEETAKRFQAAVKKLIATPHKPHKPVKGKKAAKGSERR